MKLHFHQAFHSGLLQRIAERKLSESSSKLAGASRSCWRR